MRLKAIGFSNGTAQRVLEGSTSIGLDTLDELAARLGVSAWRLVQPTAPGLPAESDKTAEHASVARLLATLSAEEQAAVQVLVVRLAAARQRSR
jgi:transcriptional regulator with XRE-family HTH domain